MPIDIRYHAISLIAVFVALLLGVLVGFAATDPGQMREYVKELKEDNARTRLAYKEELEGLRAQDKVARDFEKAIVPELVKNRLYGRRVVVFLDGATKRAPVADVVSTLTAAHAQIAAVITLKPQLATLTPRQIIGLLRRRGVTCPADKDPRAFLSGRLGTRLAEGGSGFASFLEDEGLIRIAAGSDLSRPVGAAVMIGAGKPDSDMAKQIEEPLLLALKGANIRVVGCEYKDGPGDAVTFFKQLELPTVDCVDSYPGQVALVLTLAGADGSYGIKHTTDRLIPEFK